MTPAEGDAFFISPISPNSPFVNAAEKPRNPCNDFVRVRHSSVWASHGSISLRLYAIISVRRLIEKLSYHTRGVSSGKTWRGVACDAQRKPRNKSTYITKRSRLFRTSRLASH